jgi:tetratricopeptide (TPR) repeat protein
MSDNKEKNTRFSEGMAEFVGKNYDKTIAILTEVIENDADHKLALVARGSAYLKLENTDAALADFDRAIAIDQAYARAHHLKGIALESKNENEMAIEAFNQAIENDPEYGAAYYSRATLHSKMGNTDLATDDIQMVAHFTNQNIESFANENNVWRSNHLRYESMMESDLHR